MALKTKKCSPFGDSKKEAPEDADMRNAEGGSGENSDEPYKVFETEEEFRKAVQEEIKKMNGGAGEEKESYGGYGREAQNMPEKDNMLVDVWQRDASALKELIPEFELAEALREPAFTDVLRKGGSILEAYAAISRLPKQPERDTIYQNAHMAQRGTGEATRNPAKLSSQDFKDYIENIKNR